MLEASHRAGLTEKSLEEGRVSAKMGMDDFEGDYAIELSVQGFVYNAHSSLGNLHLDFVFLGEDEFRHRLTSAMRFSISLRGPHLIF